jgi:hypothetical protein
MSEVTQYQDDDDGYSGSLTSGRLIKGLLLRWNEAAGWIDRDGMKPPEIMVAIAISEAVQCWKGKKPVEPPITAKPLPDINDLNASVPESEWEPGLDGKPKPPWVHQYIVYLIDPGSGGFFTYINNTVGARIAWEQLREKVVTMRALRGARVVPVVRLSHRPMKTFVGMKHRPEFEVVDWKEPGGNGNALAPPKPLQLADTAATSPAKSESQQKNTVDATLSTMKEVSKPTVGEELNDEIPW